ncbi:MAG: hypothetical protein QOH41_36 [Blastocatellia bacterium]|jgi:hypothetical protein|nr:hypothetical protein [Blastocatellia bacterium]
MKTHSLSLTIVILTLIACAFQTSVAQQPTERVIRRLPVEENEPIAITDIKVNGRSVSLDKKFVADDDWLRSLVFSVKNKSDKLILYASIRLQFPRPAGSRDIPDIYDMSCGNWALQTRRPNSQEMLVGASPGETVEIRLSDQQFVGLREFLTATHYPPSIEKADLSISHVIFVDDTMWYAGSQVQRDPKDPTTWVNSRYANSKPQ